MQVLTPSKDTQDGRTRGASRDTAGGAGLNHCSGGCEKFCSCGHGSERPKPVQMFSERRKLRTTEGNVLDWAFL